MHADQTPYYLQPGYEMPMAFRDRTSAEKARFLQTLQPVTAEALAQTNSEATLDSLQARPAPERHMLADRMTAALGGAAYGAAVAAEVGTYDVLTALGLREDLAPHQIPPRPQFA
jgi:hypothetical protein